MAFEAPDHFRRSTAQPRFPGEGRGLASASPRESEIFSSQDVATGPRLSPGKRLGDPAGYPNLPNSASYAPVSPALSNLA